MVRSEVHRMLHIPLLLSPQTAKKLRGCFVYTSSAAACIVSPFTVLYAATKAFLSAFGAGLAAEVRHKGIDVLVFHPSPVATRFYDKARAEPPSPAHGRCTSAVVAAAVAA